MQVYDFYFYTTVRLPCGNTVMMRCSSSCTAQDVISRLVSSGCIPRHGFYATFNGKRLHSRPLTFYGIRNGGYIKLHGRLLGGMPRPSKLARLQTEEEEEYAAVNAMIFTFASAISAGLSL